MVKFPIPIRPKYPTKWRDHYVDPKDEKTEWFNPWRYKIGKWEYGTEDDYWTRHPTYPDFYSSKRESYWRGPYARQTSRYISRAPRSLGKPSRQHSKSLRCFRCGRTGHLIKDCYAKTFIT